MTLILEPQSPSSPWSVVYPKKVQNRNHVQLVLENLCDNPTVCDNTNFGKVKYEPREFNIIGAIKACDPPFATSEAKTKARKIVAAINDLQ